MERLSRLVERDGPPIEAGTERAVDAETIHAAIETAGFARPENPLGGTSFSLGGSAFNAIFAIAQTQVGLRLGYVGVAGRVPVIGLSTMAQFEALGIDHRFVFQDTEHLCGICLSLAEDGDRTLLTHSGANEFLADHLDRDFGRVVAYLASARVVHVTSFLDDRTPGRLLQVLRAVKETASGTAICFDPGHVWSASPTDEIEALLGLSDYLLVNYREFRTLGGHVEDEADESVAARLVARTAGGQGVVVVKLPTGIWSHRRENGKLVSDFYAQAQVAPAEIKDATGAGDVFAAGLLIVLTSDRLQVELGSLLGMRLARHKLRHVGSAGHAQFAEVTKEFIRSLADGRRTAGLPNGVFIAHGAHPEWLAVQRFIEERFELPVYSFESGSWGGRQVTEALADYLERCGFAICVLTAEDFTGDGRRLARHNVVHEVGLFQGRHGFDRVMVLVEEGCDFVPQAAQPYTISFPRNGISRTFYQLDEMIRAQGSAPWDADTHRAPARRPGRACAYSKTDVRFCWTGTQIGKGYLSQQPR
ncbi:PfkB family carbohydrate kinase [Plantactinospora sp. WMMB334]|uniref:PfkB family carbohydrate kinase n=1 Tax=Plantactinospora sp. WMMB334 TaxID=3404119 RepID=UPI003B92CA73